MVSFALFRRAVRDPSYRTVPGGTPSSAPIPIATFRKAIRVYHDLGKEAALGGIGLKASYWRTDPRGKSVARNYRNSLESYFKLDAADGRQAYDAGIRQNITVSGEILRIYMDVLVYHHAAHSARIALWDVPQPSVDEAAVMGSPIIDALESAVGLDRAHSVAFWHLRTATVIEIDRVTAKANASAAADAVRRAAGA